MQSVCVFCGANPGANPQFLAAAASLGASIAASGRTLVYGGARVGLMGAVADAALSAGGKVVGVIPQALVDKEVAHRGLTELHVVSSMHARKTLMADLSAAFIAMPGGLGTLEEFFEAWTWAQLGLHEKPLGMFGPGQFFAPLLAYLDGLVEQKFVRPEHRQMVLFDEDPGTLLSRLAAYRAKPVPKWIEGP